MYWGNKKVIAVGGGKGGIGKSIISSNLAIELGKTGKRVLLVDADLGAANLHTLLGIRYPKHTLEDYISGRITNFEEIVLETRFQGVFLLSGASEILSLLSPTFKERQKLVRNLQKYSTDFIVIDLPAGTHVQAVDFFSMAHYGLVVLEPTPTSLENAFSFLKNMLFRKLLKAFYRNMPVKGFIEEAADPRSLKSSVRFKDLLDELGKEHPEVVNLFKEEIIQGTVFIVANSIKHESQKAVADKFVMVVKEYLDLPCVLLGSLPFEPQMEACVVAMTPIVERVPNTQFEKKLQEIIRTFSI
jgi:flagellar biosynthesis protein FlhG